MQFLQAALNGERKKLTSDFQRVTTAVLSMLEKSLDGVQRELDHHYGAITQSLVEFKAVVDPVTSG